MREVSVGGAISSGFRLIAREPAAFAAWCGVYLVLGFLPQLLTMGPSTRMLQAMAGPFVV